MKPEDSNRSTPEKATRKQTFFEPVALVLLSLATVGTAWCSFQAAAWGDHPLARPILGTVDSVNSATVEGLSHWRGQLYAAYLARHLA